MTPEQIEILKATETVYETGKAWSMHMRISHNDITGDWFLLIGRAEGRGKSPDEAAHNLYANINDPDYEPIPF